MNKSVQYTKMIDFVLNNQKCIYDELLDDFKYGVFLQVKDKDKISVFGDEYFSEVLDLNGIEHNLHKRLPYSFHYDQLPFKIHTKELKLNELNKLEFNYNGIYYRVAYKMIEFPESKHEILIGILQDISKDKTIQEMQNLQKIHSIAVNSGGIGIFHYDIEKFGENIFKANQLYADIVGLDSIGDELYRFSDFQKCLREIDEEIYKKSYIEYSYHKIVSGEIDKTEDDILKIQNPKSKEIKYLLSSSLVEARNEEGNMTKFGGIIIDITERVIHEKSNIIIVYQDYLTGLANKRKLMSDLEDVQEGMGLFFDLDSFKKVNDTYGHLIGDKALQEFAKCLSEAIQLFPNSKAYRLYGDEFFVYLATTKETDTISFQNKLKNKTKNIKNILGIDAEIDASMGVSLFDKSKGVDEFIKLADYSMYENKIQKKQSL